MKVALTIAKYEIKMQAQRIGFWLILAFGLALALLDNFPSEANLQRLAYLTDQGYVVSRLLMHSGLLILFGCVFLISSRIQGDRKSGILDLFMAHPIDQASYIWGKIFGNYLLLVFFMFLYLLVNAVVQALFNPGSFSIAPYYIGFLANILPACFFVAACAIALPMIIDIRLVYVIASVYFMLNILVVPDSTRLPFYFLLGGSLIKIIYRYGFGEAFLTSLLFNLAFLLGCGLTSIFSVVIDRRYWRAA